MKTKEKINLTAMAQSHLGREDQSTIQVKETTFVDVVRNLLLSHIKIHLKKLGKSYLSYAALYTHAKTKHDGQFPAGTSTLSKKKQGRPKKEDTLASKSYTLHSKKAQYLRELKNFINMIPNGTPNYIVDDEGVENIFTSYDLLACFPDK